MISLRSGKNAVERALSGEGTSDSTVGRIDRHLSVTKFSEHSSCKLGHIPPGIIYCASNRSHKEPLARKKTKRPGQSHFGCAACHQPWTPRAPPSRRV